MNMRTFWCLPALFLWLAFSANAQQDVVMLDFFTGASAAAPGTPVYLTRSSSMIGNRPSSHLSTDWEETKVYVSDTLFVDVIGRYNIQLDRMEYLVAEDTIRQIYPQQVRLVVLGDKIFLPMEYYRDFTIRIGWFEVLSAGEITLFLQREAYQRKTDYNPGTLQLDNHEWDVRDSFYYMKRGAGMPTYVFPSKRKILKLFGEHRSAMADFWKENHLRPRKAEDLRLAFIKYNQLAKGSSEE